MEIIKGRRIRPRRIVLYGVPGVGKGTWAASAPSPIFIQTEDGNNDIGVDRLPIRRTFAEVSSDLRAVFGEPHDYKTLVLDSLDKLEPMIQRDVAAGSGKKMIGEIGYGKGYDEATDDVRRILYVLDRIRDERGMTIILIAHAKIERYEDPGNEAYDRYTLQLHRKAAAEIIDWCDELLFANYITNVRKLEDGRRDTSRGLGVGSGDRRIYTQERPAYLAKSRVIGMPSELPMPKPGDPTTGWEEFAKYLVNGVIERDPEPATAQAAGTVVAPAVAAGGSEPAGQVPAAQPAEPAMTGPVPAAVAEAAAVAGLDPVDLDTLDVDELRTLAASFVHKFSQRKAAEMKKAVAERNAEKMREVIRYVMTKPDTSGVVPPLTSPA